MPFIGNQPALSYTSFAKQDFTTSATTSYILDNPVANANELALFINFVRQEPTTAYSASGTSLTLTSATSATDDMYCVFLGKAVQTVNPPNGSVGASQIVDSSIALGKLSATGTKDATTFLRGDNTFASAGGVMTPAFSAYRGGSSQSIANNTDVKIQFNTEVFDTDNCYDISNYRFTPNVAGKYFLNSMLRFNGGGDSVLYEIYIRKNNSTHKAFRHEGASGDPFSIGISAIVEANGTDYFEIFFYQASSSVAINSDSQGVIFEGYKIIE